MGVPRPQRAAGYAGAGLSCLRERHPATDRAGKDLSTSTCRTYFSTFIF